MSLQLSRSRCQLIHGAIKLSPRSINMLESRLFSWGKDTSTHGFLKLFYTTDCN